MENTKINYITVIPRIKNIITYYINDFPDSNAKRIDELYKFITSFLKPPTTLKVRELLYGYRNFIVDIENNKVYELTKDTKIIPKTIHDILKTNHIETIIHTTNTTTIIDTKANNLYNNIYNYNTDKEDSK